MKKKIINGIMMVALVAATSTSFVSCKDTNEDVKIELQAEYAQLAGRLQQLEAKYGNLDGRVGILEDKVAAHSEAIETLQKEVDELEIWLLEAFAKLVTSVEISGTYTNMVGSVNIPGFEPKMLINNWGVAEKDGPEEGWPANSDLLVEGPVLYWAANEELGTGTFEEGNPGISGYIYANVNRYLNSVPLLSEDQDEDLGMFNFSLINTRGEEAEGVKIINAEEDGGATEDLLQWGWTRAENNSNIFKFAVAYTGGQAKNFAPAKIDLSKFKADLKAIWHDRNSYSGTSKQSLGHLLADLYYNLATKDTNMPKYALKVSWKDNESGQYDDDDDYAYNEETGEIDFVENEADDLSLEHFATSEAELVFATIKPLGFNSGEALSNAFFSATGKVYATVEQSEILINKLFDKVKKQLPDLTPGQIKTIIGDGANLRYNAGTDKWELKVTVLATTTWVDVTSLIAPLNQDLESVRDMLASAQKLEYKALNATTYTQYVYKFINKMRTLVDNNADQALQPTLLVQDKAGNVNRVSGVKADPYVADGEVTLYPTTYTAELLAPAYAKFVAVKDVDEQPEGFGEIIFTNEKKLKFTPESGKTYEIVYEAVDYFGNTFEHSYFIQGK